MAFRVWLDTDIQLELGVCAVRFTSQDEVFNLKTSTWVKLPDDGRPLADCILRARHYGPAVGPMRGAYWCDFPDLAFVWGAAAMVVYLDGAGNIGSRQATYALDPKIGRINVSISRNM